MRGNSQPSECHILTWYSYENIFNLLVHWCFPVTVASWKPFNLHLTPVSPCLVCVSWNPDSSISQQIHPLYVYLVHVSSKIDFHHLFSSSIKISKYLWSFKLIMKWMGFIFNQRSFIIIIIKHSSPLFHPLDLFCSLSPYVPYSINF